MRAIRPIIERNGYAFAVLCIVTATAIFFPGRDYFAKGQWALLYLLVIGLISGLSGVRPALVAAVLAFFAWNYFFLPPYHTFVVHDPKDWLSLFAFLIVGIAIGALTGRMREREAEALAREREMALLNEFSAQLVSDTTIAEMANALLSEVRRANEAGCVTLFVPDEAGYLVEAGTAAGEGCAVDPADIEIAKWVQNESKALGLPQPPAGLGAGAAGWPISVGFEVAGVDSARRDIFVPLQTASSRQGVLHIGERADGASYSVRDAQLIVAVANQSAAFLERRQLRDVAVQADALRQADELKSTLVSSVSHELKTPLAAVTATVSNLLEQDVEWDTARIREELESAQDDLLRLNSSIGALLDLSRLEAAAWSPEKDSYEFGEIVGTAVSRIPQKQRGRISFDIPDDLPVICVDFLQWTRVVQNLLENALAYSPAELPVRVGAANDESRIRMWVRDEGPGILPEDRQRVFEKFYRGKSASIMPSGTGLGLAVTREIVQFHGGSIWIEDVQPHGARIVISLPKESP